MNLFLIESCHVWSDGAQGARSALTPVTRSKLQATDDDDADDDDDDVCALMDLCAKSNTDPLLSRLVQLLEEKHAASCEFIFGPGYTQYADTFLQYNPDGWKAKIYRRDTVVMTVQKMLFVPHVDNAGHCSVGELKLRRLMWNVENIEMQLPRYINSQRNDCTKFSCRPPCGLAAPPPYHHRKNPPNHASKCQPLQPKQLINSRKRAFCLMHSLPDSTITRQWCRIKVESE